MFCMSNFIAILLAFFISLMLLELVELLMLLGGFCTEEKVAGLMVSFFFKKLNFLGGFSMVLKDLISSLLLPILFGLL